MPKNLEKEYNPRLPVPEFPQIMERWVRDSAAARAAGDCYLDVPYGASEAETMDIFRAKGASRALMMFIHGGYWRMLDKRDHSFVAPAFTRAGVTVAVPNYALCPKVTIEEIVRQMLRATAWLYRNGGNFGAPDRKVYVVGHSAGGHLTAMMLAALWPKLAPDLPAKTVQAGYSISGVFDIEPIMSVPSVQADVRLTAAGAHRASPARMPPATDAPLYTAVGAKEPSGFHDQHELIAKRWGTVNRASMVCDAEDHFSIIDRMIQPGSALNRSVLGMMGL